MKMDVIKDMNNNIHKKCPRCDGDWIFLSDEYMNCNTCGMMACLQDNEKEYFLNVDILESGRDTSYAVYWYNDGCMITITKNDVENDEAAHLPLLPFNITYNKLQTYLIFS
jgi:hypothetical protein